MRAMPIRVYTKSTGLIQLKASFKKNWKHYLQEALGLAIFMCSACFFNVLLWGSDVSLHIAIESETVRNTVTGLLMGATALFIFYAPFTAPSGAQINPAVTITFFRLGKMCRYDALFYVLFQLAGGLLGVYIITGLMGSNTTADTVRYAVTVPGKPGVFAAAFTEYIIATITMMMVLLTSSHCVFKKYTRIFAACLVCIWVIFAGPVSGFGMNPARSFASAFPAHIYTAFWIYSIMPVAGMLTAAELYIAAQKKENG